MKTFRVWAPQAKDVRLAIDAGEEHELRQNGEWWESDVPAEPGTRYGYRLLTDEWSEVLPDPRSKSQPDGVHGLSEVIDPDFAWSDQQWRGKILPGSVLYELHVGTFTPEGTFDSAIEKLQYLADLGVTTIELMPVQPFGGNRNWGYDGVLWHCIHAGYGGPDGLRRLVDAAHRVGLGVVLDVVYNHFGPEGNYNGQFGPYTSGGSTGWGEVVNLVGPGSDEVRAYIIDAARDWFTTFHVDGLRLDAVHAYYDPGANHILEQLSVMASEVEATTGVPRSLIAESDQNDPRLVTPRAAGGLGMTAQWEDDLHHALHTLVSGERFAYYVDFGSTEVLAQTLSNVFFHAGIPSSFRGRIHGRPLHRDVIPASAFIAYTTTHDQVGNRMVGDRPSMNLTAAQQVLKAAVIYCSPFTPMLFMGEEFGAKTPFQFFCSHSDPELARLTGEGRQREFSRAGWDANKVPDPNAVSTFQASKLDWDFDEEQQRIHEAYATLLRLRRELGLGRPWLDALTVDHGEEWIAFGYEDVRLCANFSDSAVEVPIGGELVYGFTEPEVGEHSTTLDSWGFALVRI